MIFRNIVEGEKPRVCFIFSTQIIANVPTTLLVVQDPTYLAILFIKLCDRLIIMSSLHFAVQARAFTSTPSRTTSLRSNTPSLGAKRFPGSLQRQTHICNVVDRKETPEQVRNIFQS